VCTSGFTFVGCKLIFTTSPYSPAQGAMYAPLALKFVFSERLSVRRSNRLFLRAAVVQITANLTTTSGSSSRSHTGAIVGGAVGGVAGLLAIGTIVWLLRRRQRQRSTSVGPLWSIISESNY
jgi:membrane associated rhomboid family serine protease